MNYDAGKIMYYPGGDRYSLYEEGVAPRDREKIRATFVFDDQKWGPNTIGGRRLYSSERIDSTTTDMMIAACHSNSKKNKDPENCAVFYIDTQIGFGEPKYMTYTDANSLMLGIMRARQANDSARYKSKLSYKFRKALRSTLQATSNLSAHATPALSGVSRSMPTVDQTFSSHQNAVSTIASSKQIEQSNSESSNSSDVGLQQRRSGNQQGEAKSVNQEAVKSSDGNVATTASWASKSTHIVCGGPFTVPAMNQVFSIVESNSGASSVDYQCPEGGNPVLEGSYNLQAGYINGLLAPPNYKKEPVRDADGRPNGVRISWDAYRYECLCGIAGSTQAGGRER